MFCFRSTWLPAATCAVHSLLPSLRLSAHSSRLPVRSAVPTFKNTCSPQMIGVDPLRPGMGSFHAMFSVAFHLTGSPVAVLTPFSEGPRHCGQLAPDTV